MQWIARSNQCSVKFIRAHMLALYPVLPLSPYTPPLIYSNTEISRTCDHVSILALQTLPTMSTLLRLQHRVLAVVVEVVFRAWLITRKIAVQDVAIPNLLQSIAVLTQALAATV